MKLLSVLVIVGVFWIQVCGEEDLYNVLGVSKRASSAQIKKAYKKMAKEW